MMGRVDQFLDSLINYDKEHIHPDIIKAIHPYLDDPEFDPEFISSKSSAAAGLCSWVINMQVLYCHSVIDITVQKTSLLLEHVALCFSKSTVTSNQNDVR